MNSKVPTGDGIFADDSAEITRGSSSIAHFAVSPAKVPGAPDAKGRKKRLTPVPAKGNGPKDAKTKRKLIIGKLTGTNDAKTRRKIGPVKPAGTNDAKTRRKLVTAKPAGTNDAKTKRKLIPVPAKKPGAADAKILRKA